MASVTYEDREVLRVFRCPIAAVYLCILQNEGALAATAQAWSPAEFF
jgi:hypothetical protein